MTEGEGCRGSRAQEGLSSRAWRGWHDRCSVWKSSEPLIPLMSQGELVFRANAAFAGDPKMFGPAVQSGAPLALSTTST